MSSIQTLQRRLTPEGADDGDGLLSSRWMRRPSLSFLWNSSIC